MIGDCQLAISHMKDSTGERRVQPLEALGASDKATGMTLKTSAPK